MNSDSAYNQNYDLFVSLLAEMVISYITKNQIENEKIKEGKGDSDDK
jgi:hypothetical protein